MAKQYMELHPDVEIVIPESHSGEEMVNNGDFYNQYVENLVVDLMSGEAAGSCGRRWRAPPRKYVEAGVLYDIGQWMKTIRISTKRTTTGTSSSLTSTMASLWACPCPLWQSPLV